MKYLMASSMLLIVVFMTGCASHQSYDVSQFREREISTEKIALDKDGLSLEQIKMISSTRPPTVFPVDLAIIIISDGYLSTETEHQLTYGIISELKVYNKIKRITIIPKFLLPAQFDFNTIQELGVRSLSEYVLVLHINSSDIFNWTRILDSEYELHSKIDYILVDSYTSAMLTSDILFSKQVYRTHILDIKEERKAQQQLFSEQGKLLSNNIEKLFTSSKK